jgi:hypothetical protein
MYVVPLFVMSLWGRCHGAVLAERPVGFMECVKVSLLIFGNKDSMKVPSYLYIYETGSRTWCMVEDDGR